MAFSLKTSRASTDMLSYENNAIKFSNNSEKHKQHVYHVHNSSGARETGIFLKTSLSMAGNSRRAVLYIFQNIEILILVTFH